MVSDVHNTQLGVVEREFQSALRFAVVSDRVSKLDIDDDLVSIRFEVRGGFRLVV